VVVEKIKMSWPDSAKIKDDQGLNFSPPFKKRSKSVFLARIGHQIAGVDLMGRRIAGQKRSSGVYVY
jgi:hypothetical protein